MASNQKSCLAKCFKNLILLPNTSEPKFQVQNLIFSRISPSPTPEVSANTNKIDCSEGQCKKRCPNPC